MLRELLSFTCIDSGNCFEVSVLRANRLTSTVGPIIADAATHVLAICGFERVRARRPIAQPDGPIGCAASKVMLEIGIRRRHRLTGWIVNLEICPRCLLDELLLVLPPSLPWPSSEHVTFARDFGCMSNFDRSSYTGKRSTFETSGGRRMT
jgi:hypothetical protein